MRKIFLFVLFTGLFSNYFGQITTSINPTIAQMQAFLQGSGVVVSNLTITCPAGAYATFGNGAAALGGSLNTGILLTTGTASNIAGPNTSGTNPSYDASAPGSPLGDALSGGTTFDGCYINFLITPTCATLSISYVFASEEYPEFSVGTINDVFGFTLSGPNPAGGNFTQTNIATLPGTTTPVSIQNVNNGNSNTGPCVNCPYYIDSPPGLLYDGCTTVLTASATVTPCQTYTMTIGVWDDSDGIYDSGVFLDVNGLSCSGSPTLTAAISTSVLCTPQTLTLSAGGGLAGGTYTWVAPASGGLSGTPGPTVTATPTASTTYTLTYSDLNTCPGIPLQEQVSVTFTSSPSFSVTKSPSTSICTSQSVTLTANGGAGTYSWTPGTFLSTSTGSVVVSTPSITTTYSVTKTTTLGCTSTTAVTITVSPPSTIAITPSVSTICPGQSIVLSSSGTGPFSWTASSGTNPPSTGTVNVTPTISTTYTVLSGTGTCTSTAVATVSISTIPSISITPSNTTICSGQTVTLSSSGGTGPFTWTASSGTNPPSTGTVNVTPTISTTYTVLSGTGTCTASAVASINVSPTLSVTITPSNTTICSGTGINLTANGATSYTWFPSLSTAPSLSVTPATTTTYSLIGTDGVCTKSATATVTVISVSTSVTSSSPVYCAGGSAATLTASGATTYSWVSGTGLSSTTGAVVTATPTSTSIYTVTGTTSGCVSSQTILITVPPVSTITATTSNSVICIGGSATLTASGASTYTWAPGSIASPTINVNPVAATTYTVIGKTTDGCFAMPAVITVSVLPAINPTAFANSSTVCITNTVSIITSTVTAGLTYTWQPVSAIQGASNTSSIIAQPASSVTVIYTVTISNGVCDATDTIQLRVLTPPTAINFITLNNDTVCVGGCVTFSSTTTGSQPKTYKWFYESGVGTSSVGIAPEACYPSAGSFSVTLITTNACGTDTLVKSNYITVYNMPTLTVSADTTIKIGESVEIFASGGFSYNWSPNINGTIACTTCSNTVVQPTLTTNYIVVASNSIYCKVQDTVIVNVDVNCGDFFIPNVFSPNGDGLNDVINVHGRCISTFNLQIFNRWGEKVFETSSLSESWDGSFRGQKLDTGVFIYKADGVSIDEQSFNLKGNITLIR